MAKTAGKREKKEKETLVRKTFTAPPPGKVVQTVQGQFWNPEPGDTIEGKLVGTTAVKNRRGEEIIRHTLVTGAGQVLTLPDHYDLSSKLRQIVADADGVYDPPIPVWIGFEGFEAAKVAGGKLARYTVVQTELDSVVPF